MSQRVRRLSGAKQRAVDSQAKAGDGVPSTSASTAAETSEWDFAAGSPKNRKGALTVSIHEVKTKEKAKKKNKPKTKRESFRRSMSNIMHLEKKKYTVYVIEIRNTQTGESWNVERRYSHFLVLHRILRTKFPEINGLKFPKKKYWGTSLGNATVDERRKFFVQYLQEIIELNPRPGDVNAFLDLNKHAASGGKGSDVAHNYSLDDFELLKMLGKGSFGKVFLVRLVNSDDLYAMKVLKKSEVVRRKQVQHTKTERKVMGSIRHPFIVALEFAFQTRNKLFMVSEFCSGGELFFHLKKRHRFSEEMVRFYSAEIASAIAHLHKHNVVYRDLKPENVLMDAKGHVKITDFGLSRDNVVDAHGATTFCGTPEYLSPEMILHRRSRVGYGKAVDWWSLGTLMYEMLTGWPPFYDRNIRKMCEKILTATLRFPPQIPVSPSARRTISRFLERDPNLRLGSRGGDELIEIQQEEFFRDLDWIALLQLKLAPPFKPKAATKGKDYVQNFDKNFTKRDVKLSKDEKDIGKDGTGFQFDDFTFAEKEKVIPGEYESLWG